MLLAISIIYIMVIQSAALAEPEACNSCCSAGVPGIPGHHGNPGAIGPQGINGEKGIKGEYGEQGMNGQHGMKGENGQKGMKGEKGLNGEQGINGEQGLKGDGKNGLDGIPGKLGPQGPRGPIGLPGAIGAKGEKGEQTNITKSAFTVAFKRPPGRPTGPLKYDTTITNLGSHYNTETGKFVCEIPGVYVFQVTSQKTSGPSKVGTAMIRNGNRQVSTMTHSDTYSSVSTMVVLDLVVGDEVWTEPFNSQYNYYYGHSNGYCSFSGFLLYPS